MILVHFKNGNGQRTGRKEFLFGEDLPTKENDFFKCSPYHPAHKWGLGMAKYYRYHPSLYEFEVV